MVSTSNLRISFFFVRFLAPIRLLGMKAIKKEYFIDTPKHERSYEHREFMLVAGCLAKLLFLDTELPREPSDYTLMYAKDLLDELDSQFDDPENPKRCTSVRVSEHWIRKAKKVPLLYAAELVGLYQEDHPCWNFVPN